MAEKGANPFAQYSEKKPVNVEEKQHMFNEVKAHTDTDTDAYAEELKTKRMYLLVRPSVAEKISAAAKAQRTSANELIHQLMEQYIKENNL